MQYSGTNEVVGQAASKPGRLGVVIGVKDVKTTGLRDKWASNSRDNWSYWSYKWAFGTSLSIE